MRASKINQAGIGHVIAVLVLVFVAVVGFAGYSVISMNDAGSKTTTPVVADQKDPEAINSKADLQKADATLSESEGKLDSSLDDKELDADLESML